VLLLLLLLLLLLMLLYTVLHGCCLHGPTCSTNSALRKGCSAFAAAAAVSRMPLLLLMLLMLVLMYCVLHVCCCGMVVACRTPTCSTNSSAGTARDVSCS
jgi:hypothetical protein